MTAWGLGMRFRIFIEAVFCLTLGAVLLLQSVERNRHLAERLHFGWTPPMLGWVLLVVGVVLLAAVVVNSIPVAGVVAGGTGVVFVAITVSIWPMQPDQSYWLPVFTAYAACNQMASLLVLGSDRS